PLKCSASVLNRAPGSCLLVPTAQPLVVLVATTALKKLTSLLGLAEGTTTHATPVHRSASVAVCFAVARSLPTVSANPAAGAVTPSRNRSPMPRSTVGLAAQFEPPQVSARVLVNDSGREPTAQTWPSGAAAAPNRKLSPLPKLGLAITDHL